MDRKQMLETLCVELEKVSESLPSNADKHLADLRAGITTPAWEAVLKAMQRVEEACAHDGPHE